MAEKKTVWQSSYFTIGAYFIRLRRGHFDMLPFLRFIRFKFFFRRLLLFTLLPFRSAYLWEHASECTRELRSAWFYLFVSLFFFRFVNLLSFQKHVINAQIFVLRISNKILFRIFTFRHNVRSLSGPCWPKRFESKIPKRYIGEKHIERWIRSS